MKQGGIVVGDECGRTVRGGHPREKENFTRGEWL